VFRLPPPAFVLLSSASLFCLGGCAVGPDWLPPEVPELDASFEGARASEPVGDALEQWWTRLDDPSLNALVSEALGQNLDLKIAEERLIEARALRRQSRASLFPAIDGNGAYTNIGLSETTDDRFNLGGLFGRSPDQLERWRTGFEASWELDIFGGNRRRLQQATAELEAVGERANATRLALVSEVLDAYYSLAGAEEQLARVRANITLQRDTVEQVQTLLDEGLGSELDLRRARAQLAATEAEAPPFRAAITAQQRRLSLLLGRKPSYMDERAASFRGFPVELPLVTTGVPAELLVRRPDLRLAERELAAATAEIGVATSNFYPRFILFGAPEVASSTSANLFDVASLAWEVGPRVEWSLFTSGRNKAILAAANSRERQALLAYEEAVLRAAGEVEINLARLQSESQRLASLTRSVQENRASVRLARELYREGLEDFLSVLVEEQRLIEAEITEVQSRTALLQSWVALHRALGGGW